MQAKLVEEVELVGIVFYSRERIIFNAIGKYISNYLKKKS